MFACRNDEDEAPSTKKRKTASVLVEQPADSDKIVVDNVTDVAATFEEVCPSPHLTMFMSIL